MTNKNARSFVRFLTAGATSCEFDKQGRVLIPATLRKFAGIEKDVVLAGLLNRIEIWSEEKWNENNNYEEIDMDEIAGQLTELGRIFNKKGKTWNFHMYPSYCMRRSNNAYPSRWNIRRRHAGRRRTFLRDL